MNDNKLDEAINECLRNNRLTRDISEKPFYALNANRLCSSRIEVHMSTVNCRARECEGSEREVA